MFHHNKRLYVLGLLIALSCCFMLFSQVRAEIPLPWADPNLVVPANLANIPNALAAVEPGDIVIGPKGSGGTSEEWIEDIVGRAIDYLFLIGVIMAPLIILIGAFMFFTAAGDPTRAQAAKKVIIWAVIGLAILLFAKAIIGIVQYLLK